MIIVRLAGGLGNQLFQMAAAIQVSQHLNQPYFFYAGHLGNYATKRQPMLGVLFGKEIQFVKPTFWLRLVLRYRLNKLFSFGWHVHNNNIAKLPRRKVYVLDDYFQNTDLIEQGIKVVAFKIEQAIRENEKVKGVHRQLVKNVGEEAVVAIHVRRGDFLKPQNAALYPTLQATYYNTALAQHCSTLKKVVEISETPVFTAAIFPGKELVHIKNFQLTDVEEFLLLSTFKNLVIANSTFSFWAALSHAGDRHIYGPKNWANNPAENNLWNNNLLRYLIHLIK